MKTEKAKDQAKKTDDMDASELAEWGMKQVVRAIEEGRDVQGAIYIIVDRAMHNAFRRGEQSGKSSRS